jgi:glycosyltransferase involved in cell wall biosynthesis
MRNFFSSNLFRKKTRLIPFAVDTNRFNPGEPCRLKLKEKHKIHPKAITVSCVAHLLPVKGQDLLIRAISHIPDIHLFLAGRADDKIYTNSLENLVSHFGLKERVHFLGPVNDVPALLAESDIFVLPTIDKFRSEALGVALLEAMASSKPCIASDTPGPRDVIQHQINGLLFPSGDENGLARELKLLVDHYSLRIGLGEAARKRVLEHYTVEKQVANLEALYSELLHQR